VAVRRKIRGVAKTSLLQQVRENRDQYYEDNYEEMRAPYDEAISAFNALKSGDPNYDAAKQHRDEAFEVWDAWFQDNYPGNIASAARERARYKKKSKRTARSRITVTDHDLHREKRAERNEGVDIEWGDWLAVGCLVQTKDGSIGMIVNEKNYKGYINPDNAVKHGGLVQLMIDGDITWHKKINLSPLDD